MYRYRYIISICSSLSLYISRYDIYIYEVFLIQPEFFCSLLNFVLVVLHLFWVLL